MLTVFDLLEDRIGAAGGVEPLCDLGQGPGKIKQQVLSGRQVRSTNAGNVCDNGYFRLPLPEGSVWRDVDIYKSIVATSEPHFAPKLERVPSGNPTDAISKNVHTTNSTRRERAGCEHTRHGGKGRPVNGALSHRPQRSPFKFKRRICAKPVRRGPGVKLVDDARRQRRRRPE